MLTVTFKEFLRVITHDRVDEAWVARVPSITDSPPGWWFGGRYDPKIENAVDENVYYSLGLIRKGTGQRRLDNWAAGTLIVAEDVGEKSVESEKLREALGDPTFVIASSKGSAHWGWVLTVPVTDLTTMGRLQRSLTLKFYPKKADPGHERSIQYLRAPFGHNDKPARVAENDGKPQRVELIEWRPEVRIDPLDVMIALEGAWELTEHMSLAASGLSGPANEEAARAFLGSDGVLNGLEMAGLVDWSRVTNGYIGVQCPWRDQHLGVDDDRAGYNPDSRHWMCFHGSHGPKHVGDLDDWLRENVGVPYVDMRVDMARRAFASKPLPVAEEVERDAEGRLGLVPILKSPPPTPLPARRAICSHLARGEVTYRIGAPAVGKSAMALAYALAIAYERPDLIGEKTLTRTGDVVIVSNEDNADDYRKRLMGLRRKHGLLNVAPKHEIWVTPTQNFAVITKDDRYSPVCLGADMTWLGARVGADVCLTIVDTQAATFRGIEENSNADMGAAMSLVAGWAKDHNVAVEVLHHAPKASGRTEGVGDLTAARGAGAAGASVRNAVTMQTLPEELQRKLPKGEGPTWVRETGAKGNHSGNMGVKWWQREIVDVIVVDPDADVPSTQPVPVYVYSEKPPAVIFEADDLENLYQVVWAIADADKSGEPCRLNASRHGGGVADVVVQLTGWDLDDAKATIDAATDAKLIEVVDWRNPVSRKEVRVWTCTKAGLELVRCRTETDVKDAA